MANVIDPRLFDQLQYYFYGHLWAIYSRTATTNDLGEQSAEWTTLVSNGERCYLARNKGLQGSLDEFRRSDIEAYDNPMWSCMLDAFHPEITTEMQANVDGIDYLIRGVVHIGIDSDRKSVV
mgnify:CR=1 FL=1